MLCNALCFFVFFVFFVVSASWLFHCYYSSSLHRHPNHHVSRKVAPSFPKTGFSKLAYHPRLIWIPFGMLGFWRPWVLECIFQDVLRHLCEWQHGIFPHGNDERLWPVWFCHFLSRHWPQPQVCRRFRQSRALSRKSSGVTVWRAKKDSVLGHKVLQCWQCFFDMRHSNFSSDLFQLPISSSSDYLPKLWDFGSP